MTDTIVSNLIINKLTRAQYDQIENPSDTELYLIPDEIDDTPTSGSDNPVTSDGVYNAISGKQDTISDLTIIRSGASAGATAYQKPSGGIPASDLASAVQTSLGKADSALQSFTETDPTVPSWAKQSSKPTYTAQEVGALPASTSIPSKTSDLTNDSGFLTQHQDISGKENISNKVTSLSSSSTDTQYPSAKCVYEAIQNNSLGDYVFVEGEDIYADFTPISNIYGFVQGTGNYNDF